MSRIDKHQIAEALVKDARRTFDGSTLQVSNTYGDANTPTEDSSLFFKVMALDGGGPRRPVSDPLAELVGAAVGDLASEIVDRAIQLAEMREREAFKEAQEEAAAFLAMVRGE